MLVLLVSCAAGTAVRSPPPGSSTPDAPPSLPATSTPGGPDPTSTPGPGTTDPCGQPPGSVCDPYVADPLPFADSRDTRDAVSRDVDAYGCAPDTDESGPEVWYVVTLVEGGVLSAGVDDEPGDRVDVDVHLLSSTDPGDCIARDNVEVSEVVDPGTYYVVVDTWVDGDGAVLDGPYTLTVGFAPLADGDCTTVATDVRMYWSSCAASVPDCFSSGGSIYLATPTVGPVVKEAHLVTVDDDFGGGWPGSFFDGIGDHYALSDAATTYVMNRQEPWAPAGEGGSEYGQSAYGAPLPVEDEAWYLNMYWRDRPDPGTRLIVRNPANGRAVVAAGGYETGPGDNTAIGGVTEEVHDWLGTGHLDDLEIGFAADDTLPLGPIVCP